jgi:hypothetical protein
MPGFDRPGPNLMCDGDFDGGRGGTSRLQRIQSVTAQTHFLHLNRTSDAGSAPTSFRVLHWIRGQIRLPAFRVDIARGMTASRGVGVQRTLLV